MNNLTIYYGKTQPAKARGKHQANLLHFAFKYRGWHSINARDRAAMRAMKGLEAKGFLQVVNDQFRFKG
jgi:hypothetical protein